MSSKIDKASRATDQAFQHVGKAVAGLNFQFEGRVVNGAGVHRDPSQARQALAVAISELTAAKAVVDATAWPTSADYSD